jgi:hypothetical protein
VQDDLFANEIDPLWHGSSDRQLWRWACGWGVLMGLRECGPRMQ